MMMVLNKVSCRYRGYGYIRIGIYIFTYGNGLRMHSCMRDMGSKREGGGLHCLVLRHITSMLVQIFLVPLLYLSQPSTQHYIAYLHYRTLSLMLPCYWLYIGVQISSNSIFPLYICITYLRSIYFARPPSTLTYLPTVVRGNLFGT
jgi:hypothetical protein